MARRREILSPDACWEHLRRTDLGRLAIVLRGHPFVFPLNFMVDGPAVVFRTGDGVKLDGVLTSPTVALEADAVDADTGTAWSVIVVGRALAVADPERVRDLTDRMPDVWDEGDKPYFVEIHPDDVSGRVITEGL